MNSYFIEWESGNTETIGASSIGDPWVIRDNGKQAWPSGWPAGIISVVELPSPPKTDMNLLYLNQTQLNQLAAQQLNAQQFASVF